MAMEFFSRLSLNTDINGGSIRFLTSDLISGEMNTVSVIEADRHQVLTEVFPGGRAIFLGDPVFHSVDHSEILLSLEKGETGKAIRAVDGFYFLLVYYEKERKLIVASGPFSILPVYYMVTGDELIISSSFDKLVEQIEKADISFDSQYYLEKALFNYPLFDRTPLRSIKTISSNSYLEYQCPSFKVQRHTCIHHFFISDPKPWKESTESLVELFISKASDFIPKENTVAALTGGFDSRTVLSVALRANSNITTYSYGQPASRDVIIASEISDRLKIRHLTVSLDENYARKEFWPNAVSFVSSSYGLGNLSRAHYSYALNTSLKDADYLLSGNFGSELLRSMKVMGVMTSASLFDIFTFNTPEELKKQLLSDPGLNYLNHNIVENSIDNLVNDIIAYKESLSVGLTLNQLFYSYLFEEVLRKYFGPEIMVQRKQLNHRAPFLCFSFIEAILKTSLAGANSRFRETNPFNRYRGQILYTAILSKTSPVLSDFILDRGYRPGDLLSLSGQMRMVLGYICKRINKIRQPADPDYLTMAITSTLNEFKNIEIEESVFNTEYILKDLSGNWINNQTNFNNMMSAALYYQIIKHSY